MIISIAESARQIGVNRQAIHKLLNNNPRPGYFVEIKGKFKVDTTHPEWSSQVARTSGRIGPAKMVKAAAKKSNTEEMGLPEDIEKLSEEAALAATLGHIAASKIKQERAKQEEIKTAELKKELAPLYLMKHFFSFSEKIIQRIYRKPHDIEPQLGALFLAKEPKKATQLLIRELESIVVDVQRELIDEIEKEGYKIKAAGKGKKASD